jgi:hypothetical protein
MLGVNQTNEMRTDCAIKERENNEGPPHTQQSQPFGWQTNLHSGNRRVVACHRHARSSQEGASSTGI